LTCFNIYRHFPVFEGRLITNYGNVLTDQNIIYYSLREHPNFSQYSNKPSSYCEILEPNRISLRIFIRIHECSKYDPE
ncbi:MAG TPA: hypothetical protein PLH86_04670, partial [Saprospiraceae bacterium]|nr:hypothetical protein [Saprospiraceae bacterium]